MTTELYLNGAWVDVTGPADTTGRIVGSAVKLERGIRDEMASVAPGRMRLALDNQDGRWSPDNPSSPYYGQLRRNIPVRHAYGLQPVAATGSSTSAVTSHVAPSVTAAEAGLLFCGWQALNVSSGATYTLPGGITSLGEVGNGVMGYESVSAGATGTRTATFSTSARYVSASMVLHGTSLVVEDFQSVSGTNTITPTGSELELADLQAGWWLVAFGTRLNSTLGPDQTPIRDAPCADEGGWILLAETGPLQDSTLRFQARIWVKRVNRDGTQTVRSDFGNFTDYLAVAAVSGTVTDFDIRLSGEASSITPQIVAGRSHTSEIIAQGPLRRMQQGARPLGSAMRRAILNNTQLASKLIAYWPCEDEAGSFSSVLPGGRPLLVSGDPSYAQDATSFPGSAPLPIVSGSTWSGSPLPHTSEIPRIEAWCVFGIPAAGLTDGAVPLRMAFSSAAMDQVDLIYNTASSGSLTLKGYLSGSEVLATTASTGWNGKRVKPRIVISENAFTITAILVLTCMEGDLSDSQSDTLAGGIGGLVEVSVNPTGSLDESTVGQIFIALGENFADELGYLIDDRMYSGYDGEPAARRIERLSLEEGVTCHIVGDPDESEAMGPQGIDTLLGHYRAAEITDGGLLHELRQTVGIGYRTRMSLYNQPAVLSVAYTSLTPLAFDLTHDDRYTRNRVIVARDGGGEAVAEDLDGALGINEVGLYETKYQTVAQTDARLPALASWLLHIGTVDEPRARVIRTDLHTNDANRRQLLALDVGDRLTITDVPTTITSRDVDVLYLGASEVHRPGGAVVELGLTARPASPFKVGTYESTSATAADRPTRYAAANSAIGSGLILPGASGAIARTPDVADLDITGDLTIAIDVRLPSWTPSTAQTLVSKAAAGAYSYNLGLDTNGKPTLTWSADGTTTIMATATTAIPASANDRLILLAHLDVDNGAGAYSVSFRYSTDSASQDASATTSAIGSASYTTLGSAVVGGATTSIFASTTNLAIGGLPSGTADDAMIVYSAVVTGSLSVSSSVRADPVFTGRSAGQTSFTDDAGRTWSILGTAYIAGRFETGSDTVLLVHTPAPPYWNPSALLPMDIELGGCILTVSAISGTGPDQQFTISAATPAGVTIGYGQLVSLVDRGIYAL